MSNKLYVCFLENDEEIMEHHWLNRMAAKLAPETKNNKPKIHVELFFPSDRISESDEIVSGQACSIYYNNKVFLTHKNFSRKQWSFRTLDVSATQYKKIHSFCKQHVGDTFNHLSYFTYPVNCKQITPYWPQRFNMRPKWFCSEIVIEALKHGNVLDQSIHPSMHPEKLYSLLESSSTPDCVRNYGKIKLVFT